MYQNLAAHNKQLNERKQFAKINDTTVNKLNEVRNNPDNVKHLLVKELRRKMKL